MDKENSILKEYQVCFDNFVDPIVILDSQGTFLLANKRFEEISGFSPVEVLGKSLEEIDLFIPESKVLTLRNFARRMKGENPAPYEIEVLTPGGETIPCQVNAFLINHQDEKLDLVVLRDLREKKKWERELAQERDFSLKLIETSGAMILTLNLQGEVTSINPAGVRLLGYEKEEIVGKNWFEHFLPSKEVPDTLRVFQKNASGQFLNPHVNPILRKDGTKRIMAWNNTVVTDSEGKITGILAIAQDITEQENFRREIFQEEKAASIGRLVSGVTHELNNPLTGVLGYCDLLLHSNISGQVRSDVQKIEREAERVAKIVRDLLVFSRQKKPERNYLDLNSLLEEAIFLQSYRLKQFNIKLIKEFDPELPTVFTDTQQLGIVFLNLLANAQQSLKEVKEREITVKTEKGKNLIRVIFRDTGPGISPENMEKIFDPFFTTREVGEGTGLGLSVSWEIVKQLGGRLFVVSRPGRGASFVVELPTGTTESVLGGDV